MEFSYEILYDDLDPSGSGDGEDGDDDDGSGEVPCEVEGDELDRAELWHENERVAVVNKTGNSTRKSIYCTVHR